MLGKGGLLGNTAAQNALRELEQVDATGRVAAATKFRSALGGVAAYGSRSITTGDGGQLDVEIERRPIPGKPWLD